MKELSKITCDLLGPGSPGGTHNFGLGNQMFQIATVLSLAKDNNFKAVFPMLRNVKYYGEYINSIFKNLNTNGDFSFAKCVYEDDDFVYEEIPIRENMAIRGYFQSEKYFVKNRDLILETFDIENNVRDFMDGKEEIINSLKNKDYHVISMHVRRKDYVNLKDMHPVLDLNYYYNAIEYIKRKINKKIITIIFSDDIEWCIKNFQHENDYMFFKNSLDVVDMCMMSLCDSNIIANSSFSWWGAWLNNNNEKIVIAPKKWFGDKRNLDDKDIIPEDWVKI